MVKYQINFKNNLLNMPNEPFLHLIVPINRDQRDPEEFPFEQVGVAYPAQAGTNCIHLL